MSERDRRRRFLVKCQLGRRGIVDGCGGFDDAASGEGIDGAY